MTLLASFFLSFCISHQLDIAYIHTCIYIYTFVLVCCAGSKYNWFCVWLCQIPMSVWVSETWVLFAATFLPASFIPNVSAASNQLQCITCTYKYKACCSMLPQQVGLVWNFVGSIGGTLVLYIFPAAFFLRLRYMRYVRRRKIRGTSIRSQYNWYAVIREVVATIILVTGEAHVIFIIHSHAVISDLVHCAQCILLCLVVCLTLLASFFLPSHLSLKHVPVLTNIIFSTGWPGTHNACRPFYGVN